MNINLKFILFLLTLGLFITSCSKEETTFDDLGSDANKRGAIMNVAGSTPGFYNFVDPSAATNLFSYSTAGEAVSSSTLTLSLNGAAPVDLETFTSFPGSYTMSLEQAAVAVGSTLADMQLGDVFTFGFKDVVTSSGTYRSTKTLNVAVSCPSTLAGDYDVTAVGTSTDVCCPDETTVTGVVTLTSNGGGKYGISDWSGGLYLEWYDIYGITATSNEGEIEDICDVITLLDDTEPFGETLEASGSVDPATGIITYSWSNGYGDQGTVTMTPQ